NRLGTGDDLSIAVTSAVYNAADHSVQLTPGRRLALNQFFRITVRSDSADEPGSRLTDRAGNLLDGDRNGTPGGSFVAFVGRGTDLAYVDKNGAKVSLSISLGVMELIRSSDGNATHLRLDKTVPAQSKLTGSVRTRSGQPHTAIRLITNSDTFQNQ